MTLFDHINSSHIPKRKNPSHFPQLKCVFVFINIYMGKLEFVFCLLIEFICSLILFSKHLLNCPSFSRHSMSIIYIYGFQIKRMLNPFYEILTLLNNLSIVLTFILILLDFSIFIFVIRPRKTFVLVFNIR